MTEEIQRNPLGEQHAIMEWEGTWYKLPFYLLQDLIPDCKGLGKWLMKVKTGDYIEVPAGFDPNNYTQDELEAIPDHSIPHLKQILQGQMKYMEAYKIYEL